MESIIQKEKECLVCHTRRGLHRHHVFGGPNRPISERTGMTVWLCGRHHNMSRDGVHRNKCLDMEVKRLAQHTFEQYRSREEFMELFGRNYL